MKKIFIDGSSGTTGLQIQEKLRFILEQNNSTNKKIELLAINENDRKNPLIKRQLIEQSDLVILCLPDEAAIESVKLIEEIEIDLKKEIKILDASTAHRTAKNWIYGFPELNKNQTEKIKNTKRVSNPGCYATGIIALLNPLVSANLIPKDFALNLFCISGYSGGGRQMIESFEKNENKSPPFETYALNLEHKHLPEIMKYSGLIKRPIFIPSVANFPQGMLIQIPIHLDNLNELNQSNNSKTKTEDLFTALNNHYLNCEFIKVLNFKKEDNQNRISADNLKNTNYLELMIFENSKYNQVILIARLDNLGKGASGAAIQNLKIMLNI